MESFGGNQNIQQRQVAVNRKMVCCVLNAAKQMNNKRKGTIQCYYCSCTFYQRKQRDEHMKIHECPQCHEIAIGDDAWAHQVRHQQEAQLAALQKQRQRQMDNHFVHCYVKANRLHEYRSQLDYEPNVEYIMLNYQFQEYEWLAFVKKFKHRFLNLFYGGFKVNLDYKARRQHERLIWQFNAQMISYLLENGALFVCDAIDFLNILMTKAKYDDYVSVLISYLLKKGWKIEAEWVARAINDDELIERIKAKHTFTFNEIHKARRWELFSAFDVDALKTFYAQLQKNFFNPQFENPFDDFDDETDPCCFREPERFIYDKENDQLQMVVGDSFWQKTHLLGSCAEMMKESLADLVEEYEGKVKVFHKLLEKSERLMDERDEQVEKCKDKIRRHEISMYYHHQIYVYGQAQQDKQECMVAKLYFVISMK